MSERMGRPRLPEWKRKAVSVRVYVTPGMDEAVRYRCDPGEMAEWVRGAIQQRLDREIAMPASSAGSGGM